jgi:hypothetical protein
LPSKSTALQAKVLAPNQTTVHEFPNFPDYRTLDKPDEQILLLYPSPVCHISSPPVFSLFANGLQSVLFVYLSLQNAKFIGDIDISKVRRVLVVDSQWHRTARFLRDDRLKGLATVKIDTYKTKFWRFQDQGEECLATLEGEFSLSLSISLLFLVY